jgi:hypothetical protein
MTLYLLIGWDWLGFVGSKLGSFPIRCLVEAGALIFIPLMQLLLLLLHKHLQLGPVASLPPDLLLLLLCLVLGTPAQAASGSQGGYNGGG